MNEWTLSEKLAGAGHRAVSLHRDCVLVSFEIFQCILGQGQGDPDPDPVQPLVLGLTMLPPPASSSSPVSLEEVRGLMSGKTRLQA